MARSLVRSIVDILTINDSLGKHPTSYYAATAPIPKQEGVAKGTINTDVCVVGAGFSGLSTALHLARQGFRVVVLEANRIGSGASGRNGGQASNGQRVNQITLEKRYGLETAKLLWQQGLAAKSLIHELIDESSIDCEYKPGVIDADHRQRFAKESAHYAEHLNHVYDYKEASFLDKKSIRAELGSQDYHCGILDKGSGHLHPLRFTLALAELAKKAGVDIYEQSRMINYRAGTTTTINTESASVNCKFAVLCLNGYHNNIDKDLETHVMPINNYICATEPLSQPVAESLIKNDYAVADSRFVINYFRLSSDRRLLFGGGETYRYQFPKDIRALVSKPMLQIFPQLKDIKLDYAWGGTLGITRTRMPYFSRIEDNVISIGGYSGQGIALATWAGKLAAETIAGQAQQFDLISQLPSPKFPGGALLRQPALVAGMLWYSLLDKL